MIVLLKPFGLVFLMDVIGVFLYMERLLPTVKERDLVPRLNVAAAIVEATDDRDERAMLTTIARWESYFRPDVFDCRVRSTIGARGPWQVLPRSRDEAKVLCLDMAESARRALQRVEESRKICRHLPKREQLAQYATGRCEELGKKMSRLRWSCADDMSRALGVNKR